MTNSISGRSENSRKESMARKTLNTAAIATSHRNGKGILADDLTERDTTTLFSGWISLTAQLFPISVQIQRRAGVLHEADARQSETPADCQCVGR